MVPRAGWQKRVEDSGVTWHTDGERTYWNESACYEFTATEIDRLEAAAAELHALCIEAGKEIVRRGWWARVGIREREVPLVRASWEAAEWSLYGRFDVAWTERGELKLLEYNADTPTSLVEAAVAQWQWLQDLSPELDQFNSIHERIVAAWRTSGHKRIHFSTLAGAEEDAMTCLYLAETARQAGLDVRSIALSRIGWNAARSHFLDEGDFEITACFKLYPWEAMLRDEFAQHLAASRCKFIEPPWKSFLSNKGLLAVLWELFPDHALLLPAFADAASLGSNYVKKPIFGREGANVEWVENGTPIASTDGDYGEEGFIFQAPARIALHDGYRPILGLWIVAGEPAGLGVREDSGLIVGNWSPFVPHRFRD